MDQIKIEDINRQKVYLYETDLLKETSNIKSSNNVFNFKYRDVHFFKSELNLLTTEIKKAQEEKKKIIILSGNEHSAKKIEDLLEPEEIKYKYIEKLEEPEEKIRNWWVIKYDKKNKKVMQAALHFGADRDTALAGSGDGG